MKKSLNLNINNAINNYINSHEQQFKKIEYSKKDLVSIKNNILLMLQDEFGENMTDIDDNYIKVIENRINKTKKRWLKKELSTENKLFLQVEKAKFLYETVPEIGSKFEELYGVYSPNKLQQMLIDDLKAWCSDKSAPLVGFKYITDKLKYQLSVAVENDMQKIISEEIVSYKKENRELTLEMPEVMKDIPINFSKDEPIKKENIKTEGEQRYYQHIYQIDEDKSFETLVELESLKSDTISMALKKGILNTLNKYDLSTLLYVLSQREANFLSDGRVVLPLIDIIKNVYPSDSSYYYEKCRMSLHKLALQRVSAITKDSKGFTIGVLDSVFVGQDNKQGQEMVEVVVSDVILSDLLKRRTIKMYKESILKLKHPASQILVFNLQSKRINYFAETKDSSGELDVCLDISFFRGSLMLSNKRDDKNAKVLEKAMEELVRNNLVIKYVKRKGYSFHVKFLPFSDKERENLLQESEMGGQIFPEIPMTKSINNTH